MPVSCRLHSQCILDGKHLVHDILAPCGPYYSVITHSPVDINTSDAYIEMFYDSICIFAQDSLLFIIFLIEFL